MRSAAARQHRDRQPDGGQRRSAAGARQAEASAGPPNPADGSELIDARLGRPANDVLEAAIVLEAWGGAPASEALAGAPELVRHDVPRQRGHGRTEHRDDRERASLLGEALTLVMSILSVAAWAQPLRATVGAETLTVAVRIALPLAIALQWAARSRYLSRREGLSLLAHDGPQAALLLLVAIFLPLALSGAAGRLAALLTVVWTAGAILTRRGWGVPYGLTLVLTTVALDERHSPYLPLGALALLTSALCVAALRTRRAQPTTRAGSVRRAVLAALLGGGAGVLMVGDPSLGWGVRGSQPALALLPAVAGSFWGGYHLWNLYQALPEGLRGLPLEGAARIGFGDPAMRVFLGAVARLLAATLVLSGVVLLAGGWVGEADRPSLFLAFGCVSLLTLMISLLESLSLNRAAALALAVALLCEFGSRELLHWQMPGGALTLGAAAGILLSAPALIALLARSGRVLATTLWIR